MITVYVGMSGGVDSSVTAALLKEQGYRVVGVFMQNWTQSVAGVECPWREDLADAKAVAASLDIPLKVYDFQTQYKQKVVDYMVAEYQAGRTPNPDIMCNQEIKFKLFLDTALADGADMIATGHYARVIKSTGPATSGYPIGAHELRQGLVPSSAPLGSLPPVSPADHFQLHVGVDQAKDQSYFLYRVPAGALAKTLMPVGEYTKPQIRQLAEKFNLPTAKKPDSQGICFIGEVGMKDFLRQYVDVRPGDVNDKTGKVLGQHEGAIFYTIGQRHGLGIGGGKPYYVISKNMADNTVTVTDNPNDLELESANFNINDLHWLGEPVDDRTYQVRARYRASLIDAKINKTDTGYRITMNRPDRAITPGQSAVIYDKGRVVGGGIITA